MKSKEQILKEHTGHAYGIIPNGMDEAMDEYAKEKAREVIEGIEKESDFWDGRITPELAINIIKQTFDL